MAWVEKRGKRFRMLFRIHGEKYIVSLKVSDQKAAAACLARVEENIRLDKKVEIVRVVRLAELFKLYRTSFRVGAKEKITLKMENIHLRLLLRIIGDRRFASNRGYLPGGYLSVALKLGWS